ncbi:ABC transporter permease subunit [Thermomicrobium sp. CFH 73360]|uniref:ABC transporter permease n=1 Tax=Thermomicrobium sp. CFH 73360 TaxID=2951987 RepID=UPI002077484B|nr:ABC transporter permease subunit [Thermomicrobium sp. CFH 73360]MCM8746426.1 ABC transporter permease subunit [Thermomicrobium sp. CFH 73360]
MAGNTVLVLAQKELRDALRNRWFLADAVALLVLSSALSLLVFLTGATSPVSGFGRTAASLVNLMLLLVPLMGLTLGALALASDRERSALEFWLAQPVGTGAYFLSKALGIGLALAAAVTLGFGASAVFLLFVGATDPLAFLALTGLTILLAWTSLTLGLLLSSRCSRTSTAVSLALGLWLVLVLLGNLGLMGTALAVRLPPSWLLGIALVNPTEAYRIAALRLLAGTLELLGPAGLYADERFGATLPHLLASMLLLWSLVGGFATYAILRREVLR